MHTSMKACLRMQCPYTPAGGQRATVMGPSGEQIMAKRWASRVLVGLGLAGLLPTSASAQGVPEPMPMQPPGGWHPAMMQGQPLPTPGGPGMHGMHGMPGPAMGGMPGPGMGMPGPGMGMPGPGMPPGGFPASPMIDPASFGPNGTPGVDLPMGATYYPGISGDGSGGLFSCCKSLFYCESGERRGIYGKLGYIAMWRESLPRIDLVAIEPATTVDLTDPTNPFIRPTTDGDPVTLFPFIFDMGSLSPRPHNGAQFAVGIQDNDACMMWELGGYFASFGVIRKNLVAPGRLDTPYFNAPVGFQDTAGLWLNADLMAFEFGNSVWSAETNLRWFGSTWKCFDVNYLVGLRYVKLYERFTHYTVDDDIQFGVNDPTTRANLTFQAENDMLGAQVGFGMTQWLSETWSLSYDQKVGLMANGAKSRNRLVRDDGLVGFDTVHTTWRFATIWEGGLYLGLGTGGWRARAGYEYKIFSGVSSINQQFTFDLQDAAFRHKSTDTLLYHGPSLSIEWVF
jgi:hypothetical protein